MLNYKSFLSSLSKLCVKHRFWTLLNLSIVHPKPHRTCPNNNPHPERAKLVPGGCREKSWETNKWRKIEKCLWKRHFPYIFRFNSGILRNFVLKTGSWFNILPQKWLNRLIVINKNSLLTGGLGSGTFFILTEVQPDRSPHVPDPCPPLPNHVLSSLIHYIINTNITSQKLYVYSPSSSCYDIW